MKFADHCAKCGACSVVCPLFQITGRESRSPRGRMHLLGTLSSVNASPAFTDILSQCLLCGACKVTCPRKIDIPAHIIAARHDLPQFSGGHPFLRFLAHKMLSHPWLLAGAAKTKNVLSTSPFHRLPMESGLRMRLGISGDRFSQISKPADQEKEKPVMTLKTDEENSETLFFAGCYALHLEPDINFAMNRICSSASGQLHRPAGQTCCGLAALSAGDTEGARRLAEKNIAAFAGSEAPILTSCGSCYFHLSSYPDLFPADDPWHHRAERFAARLRELSTFLNQLYSDDHVRFPNAQAPARRVFYHDPCHLRFGPGITDAPRRLLNRLPGVTLVELPGGPLCCGMGGLFNIAYPDLSREISGRLVEQFLPLEADLVVTSCTGCLLQWQQLKSAHNLQVEVVHLAVLLEHYWIDDKK